MSVPHKQPQHEFLCASVVNAGLLLPASDCFPSFFVGRPSPLGFAFIPELLAFGEGQFNFYFAVLEVHADGDQRQSLLLGFADQLADFFFVHEQLAGAERGVVVNVAVLVGADVGVEQPEFAVLDQTVGVFKVGKAAANRFGLGSGKNYSTLKFFQQEVVMRSDPINGSIALTGGGRLAARGFLGTGLGLVCGLARHDSASASS